MLSIIVNLTMLMGYKKLFENTKMSMKDHVYAPYRSIKVKDDVHGWCVRGTFGSLLSVASFGSKDQMQTSLRLRRKIRVKAWVAVKSTQ